jgi:hypothetical protein
MKALLISTLLSWGISDRPPGVDQMQVWFEGPAAHAECNRAEKEIHFGEPTVYGTDKVSSMKVGTYGYTKRITQCIKFN